MVWYRFISSENGQFKHWCWDENS